MFKVIHISESIESTPATVYDFVSQKKNLPKWASGVSEAILGEMKFEFAPKNSLGVLDHDVTLATGETFYNPMRVIPNGEGSEIIFTLFKLDGVTEEMFQKDMETIRKDFKQLKILLETK